MSVPFNLFTFKNDSEQAFERYTECLREVANKITKGSVKPLPSGASCEKAKTAACRAALILEIRKLGEVVAAVKKQRDAAIIERERQRQKEEQS
jgi:hypothetical protein